jgi:hypothetical protein
MHNFPRTSRVTQILIVLVGLCFVSVSVPAFGAVMSISPTSINYGNNPVNSGPYKYLTLRNAGSGTVNVSWISVTGSFKIYNVAWPLSLGVGKSVTFYVKFVPKTTGNFTGTLSVFSTNSARVTVALSGSATSSSTGGGSGGATKGTLSFSPTSFNFGNVTVGTKIRKTVTISAATAPVTISGATTTNPEFFLSGLAIPTTISAGKSITITVNFTPKASGSTSTQFALADNATNSPGVFTATGAGISTSQHTVGLTWVPSKSTVAGYNVYRGTATGGPYSKLNSGSIVTTSFSDSTVKSGSTYFYVTTAVNSAGAESTKSNEVRATIPTP